jgi:hypothetical protein
MTNLSNSSLKSLRKLLIIHGLNNNAKAFEPLKEAFEKLGWEASLLILPNHGEKRIEAKDFSEAFACFDRNIRDKIQSPYSVIAFSQGALYFQLWMDKRPSQRPISQALLAPALFIRRHRLVSKLTSLLPNFFLIKSFSPKVMQRYSSLSVRDYRILLSSLESYQRLENSSFAIPSLVMIDPQDELVDSKALAKHCETVFVERNYLSIKMGLGRHHILFHPDYFLNAHWVELIKQVDEFLKRET